MEIMISYFWLIKLAVQGLIFGVLYLAWKRAVKTKKVWNGWTTVSFILFIVYIAMPVKMEPATAPVVQKMNLQIAERHSVLPPKIVDNTFNSTADKVGNLTEK